MDYITIESVLKSKGKNRLTVLLICPRIPGLLLSDWNAPPIGPAYVSASLKQSGKHVLTLNLSVEKGPIEGIILRFLKEYKIDLVGMGTLVTDWDQAQFVLQLVKQYDPTIITYLGGGGITCSPSEHMALVPSADIGMIGEGEVTACEMVEAMEVGSGLDKIPGLVLRNPDDSLHFNPPREPISDLDHIPWPDWDGFSFFEKRDAGDDLGQGRQEGRLICAPILASRGCPFQCTFCSKPTGNTNRKRSMDSIFAEIDHLAKHYGVNRLFLDDDLFADPYLRKGSASSNSSYGSRLEEFCIRLMPYHMQWLLYLRVGPYMTDDLLSLMRKSGCTEIFYGIESGDDTVLLSMKKGITTAMIEDTVRRTHHAGIGVTGNFIFGDSAETWETVYNTFSFAEHLSNQFSHLFYIPITLFPGSKLYQKAVKQGKITDTTDFIRRKLPLTNVSSMDDESYRTLIREVIPERSVSLITAQENNYRPERLITDMQRRELYSTHICKRCGHSYRVNFNALSLTDYTYFLCPKCGERIGFLIMGQFAHMVDPIMKELLTDGKTAIWGAAMIYRHYKAFSGILNDMDYLLVDSNPELWKTGYAGHEVFSPLELNYRDIHRVVIMVGEKLGNFESVLRQIAHEHPQITETYKFTELYFEYEDHRVMSNLSALNGNGKN